MSLRFSVCKIKFAFDTAFGKPQRVHKIFE